MAIDNDTRGWIMTGVSGIACVVGASIICIDILVQRFPRGKNFRIQDSHAFLSASLSLSFGVMLFSALYSMLPSANKSLIRGGFSPRAAACLGMGCFIGGVIAIQMLSRFLHRYIPSEIVDCHDDHDDEEIKEVGDHQDHAGQIHHHQHDVPDLAAPHSHRDRPRMDVLHEEEDTPLLDSSRDRPRYQSSNSGTVIKHSQRPPMAEAGQGRQSAPGVAPLRRPSMRQRLTSRVSLFRVKEEDRCEDDGPCHGFSNPCGRSFAQYLPLTIADGHRNHPSLRSRAKPLLSRSSTAPLAHTALHDISWGTDEELGLGDSSADREAVSARPHMQQADSDLERPSRAAADQADAQSMHHHHHVPTNAFLSIGLQTSVAIALHKLPEGFITYATNHANPKLGFSVFTALFIHNITEGFAMALPLFLALGSRWRAMFWSSLLGGVSQPLGAAVAAIWLKLAGRNDMAPGEGVYGAMFAVTAGIMTSVALQLFSESLGLTHNRTVCITFAFAGMALLGFSFALTAD
ncbi:MAG: hypothetical protein M1826_005089 [Phylliscum demangeonii]|nr:MAG: hypothetical protein M1826_005089 [Phylliscum demangeonii]